MSTYYGLRCNTCTTDSPNWFRNKEDVRTLLSEWLVIKTLVLAIEEAERRAGNILLDISIRWMGYDFDDPRPHVFMQEHEGHSLIIRDEYGQIYD